MAVGSDPLEIFGVSHAAVDHHRAAGPFAGAPLERAEHLIQGSGVVAIAGKDFVRPGKAVAVEHQAHHHLFAVGALVARIAALGLRIALGQTFEVGRGEIVEQQRVVEVKQGLFAFGQRTSIGSRWGWSLSRLRKSASSLSRPKSLCRSSSSAQRRIQSGMACSDRGAIRRLSTIASVTTPTRAESPASARICPSPNSRQIWWPTCTGPASRASSTVTRAGSIAIVAAASGGCEREARARIRRARARSAIALARASLGQRQLATECGLDPLRQRQPLFGRRRFQATQ